MFVSSVVATMYLYVAYALNPHEFYGIVSLDDGFTNAPNVIKSACDQLLAKGDKLSLSSDRHTNLMIKLGNLWLRVSESVPLPQSKQVKITLRDAGHREIPIPDYYPAVKMSESISDLRSYCFSLAGVMPSSETATWSKNARDTFCSLATGKVFKVPDYGSSRSVTLVDLESGRSLAADLIAMGLAVAPPRVEAEIGEPSNLPMESLVFLERSGGVDILADTDTPLVPSLIMKDLAKLYKK